MSYLTCKDVARTLGLSEARVRQLADAGKLPVVRTRSGVRLFDAAAVERAAEVRGRAAGLRGR